MVGDCLTSCIHYSILDLLNASELPKYLKNEVRRACEFLRIKDAATRGSIYVKNPDTFFSGFLVSG